jgi:hypothetical protein
MHKKVKKLYTHLMKHSDPNKMEIIFECSAIDIFSADYAPPSIKTYTPQQYTHKLLKELVDGPRN